MKEQVLNSVYRNRVTRIEHQVKRLCPTEYKVLIQDEWVPMRYSALKKEFSFVRRATNIDFTKTPKGGRGVK